MPVFRTTSRTPRRLIRFIAFVMASITVHIPMSRLLPPSAGCSFSTAPTINGLELIERKDTPLIAAASLMAAKVGLLYMDHGANIHHAGCHGGTASHWAAWTGQPRLVDRLIRAGADIHKQCIDFTSTPLLWAIYTAIKHRKIAGWAIR